MDVGMLTKMKSTSVKETTELRHAAGLWLKQLRKKQGLSQRALADKLDLNYYTFISQLENGRGKIPSNRYRSWAEALGVDVRVFVKKLMTFYDPATYRILFEDKNLQPIEGI